MFHCVCCDIPNVVVIRPLYHVLLLSLILSVLPACRFKIGDVFLVDGVFNDEYLWCTSVCDTAKSGLVPLALVQDAVSVLSGHSERGLCKHNAVMSFPVVCVHFRAARNAPCLAFPGSRASILFFWLAQGLLVSCSSVSETHVCCMCLRDESMVEFGFRSWPCVRGVVCICLQTDLDDYAGYEWVLFRCCMLPGMCYDEHWIGVLQATSSEISCGRCECAWCSLYALHPLRM